MVSGNRSRRPLWKPQVLAKEESGQGLIPCLHAGVLSLVGASHFHAFPSKTRSGITRGGGGKSVGFFGIAVRQGRKPSLLLTVGTYGPLQ